MGNRLLKKKTGSSQIAKKTVAVVPASGFDEILSLIQSARVRAAAAVNSAMIDLYWAVGKHISGRIARDGWGQGAVVSLAEYIRKNLPNSRGFSASNLWRMTQFYETYRSQPKLATLLRELSWSHNLTIMARAKLKEEREFYLKMAIQEQWSFRQLERQLSGALFERVVLAPVKVSSPAKGIHPDLSSIFKDSYMVEFLDLPRGHSEADLHNALVDHLKDFLIELGRDFCFVGSHYPIQVGGDDFELDLLFFHRGLNCLVNIELKIDHFRPEYLGKLNFYIEALDRKVKKAHENPSIGVLLCATRDQEVVEYALSRSASPAVIAEYRTRLPDKRLLQQKLHEFYQLVQSQSRDSKLTFEAPVAKEKIKSNKPRKQLQ